MITAKRKRYTNGDKLRMLQRMQERSELGHSLASTSRSLGVSRKLLRDWSRAKETLEQSTRSKKAICEGRTSSIDHLKFEIENYMDELRELNISLSYTMVMARACQLDANFAALDEEKRYHIVRRLCRSLGFVVRRKTHQGQKRPDEVMELAQSWLLYIEPMISMPNTSERYIINMDQTPVPFNLAPSRTLSRKNSNSVGIRRSGNSTARATAALTVCADGTKLKPLVIFKGAPNGIIARTELNTYNCRERVEFRCQKNAWTDDTIMLGWIQSVLVPHLQERNPRCEVVLLLDELASHKSASTTAALAAIGVQAHIIPNGCTALVQPCDVGINKPFKDRLRKLWWNWIISQGVQRTIFHNPDQSQVAEWVDIA